MLGSVAVDDAQAEQQVSSYGTWRSPITARMLTDKVIRIAELEVTADGLYWLEARPQENGRQVAIHRTVEGSLVELTPHPYNARTRVHEYGGGALRPSHGGIFFTNFEDQQVYRCASGAEPVAITNATDQRFTDYVHDNGRDRLIAVREDHSVKGKEAYNEIVALPLSGEDSATILVSGHDFYSTPRLSPDGAWLTWIAWNHPNMPWDETTLWIGEVQEDGSIGRRIQVAGGSNESVVQPSWSPGGTLHFVSDRTGWWNLYRYVGGSVEALLPMDAEFAYPRWIFGMTNYDFVADDLIICTFSQDGSWHLASLDTSANELEEIDVPFELFWELQVHSGKCYFVGLKAKDYAVLASLDLRTGEVEEIQPTGKLGIAANYLSTPEAIEFVTEGGMTAHAFYYPPVNPEFTAPEHELPPLIVQIHGGPTGATGLEFALGKQFWTTRGFGLLDVNYRGSTGYGRPYRDALKGQWGVADIEDAVYGVRYMIDRGHADPDRIVIRGGSAGGYTVLLALATTDIFSAGISYFGISDLELLAKGTHKFESRYLDQLVGPYPETKQVYVDRSPIAHLSSFATPTLFLQGLDDKVVPPDQAETFVNHLKEAGIPVAYIAFEGEGHGFRKSETIERAYEAELDFLSKVLHYDLPEPVAPVEIYNLPD
jgi:dipeptidyl aminopeptidase/acylaminoacyl peptidase